MSARVTAADQLRERDGLADLLARLAELEDKRRRGQLSQTEALLLAVGRRRLQLHGITRTHKEGKHAY